MAFIKKGVVIFLGAGGTSDDVRAFTPSSLKYNSLTMAYYAGYDGTRTRVCYAVSEDGMNFIKKGVVTILGVNGESDDITTSPRISLLRNGLIWLYYLANDGSKNRLTCAISEDGINFLKLGVVIPLGAANQSDDYNLIYASAIEHEGLIKLYYSADDGSRTRICGAISEDGIRFNKLGVIVPLSATGIDNGYTDAPAAILNNGLIWLYYAGLDMTTFKNRGCCAISKDGINFIKQGVVIPLGANGESDDSAILPGTVSILDGVTQLYYGAYDGSKYLTCLALSKSGI